MAEVTLKVFRGDQSGGSEKAYAVPLVTGMVVLDAIHYIQAHYDGDLACRWNCKAARCGSCSAEINGRPRLMCKTRLDEYGSEITVRPIKAFPVIKDLVTDVSWNYKVAQQIPAFQPANGEGAFTLFQPDVERAQEFRKCIECFLCQNVCHVIRDHEENKQAFAGPRFFARIAELEMHPLDQADRKRQSQEAFGLGMCNITKCCTEVCPEGIKITDNAIIPMKERAADVKYDPVRWIASTIRRRRSSDAQP